MSKFNSISQDIPRNAMEGAAVAGKFFAALNLYNFAVRIEVPDLLQGIIVQDFRIVDVIPVTILGIALDDDAEHIQHSVPVAVEGGRESGFPSATSSHIHLSFSSSSVIRS